MTKYQAGKLALTNASENLVGWVENRPGGGILYKLYKRIPISGEFQKILVSQPEYYNHHSNTKMK